jgi:type IV pilus assembly protein PilY1
LNSGKIAMNTKPQAPRRRSSAIRALGTMLVVGMLGSFYMPAWAVTVDQQPLTVQPTIPPNIVLMFDDSGSMAADYMPDFTYLKNNGSNAALIDANNNGVYYNPSVIYTPPPQASGTNYTNQTDMSSVPQNGFATSPNLVNLFTYNGAYECNDSGSCSGDGGIDFNTSTTHTSPSTGTYNQTVRSTGSGNNIVYADAVCQSTASTYPGYTSYQFTGINGGAGKWTKGTCSFNYPTTTQVTVNFFQYSTGAAAGAYTVHYVAQNAGDCAYATTPANCVLAGDTTGVAAPTKDASGNTITLAAGTNIANWFAYYHTRILMAKSGLMTAFSSVDQSFRVGFGSINGSAASWINSNISSNYPFSTTTQTNNYLAQVQPFGDAATGVQRANFWTWVTKLSPNNSTPLRVALAAVGKYYTTDQPWSTLSTDPGYGTTNPPTNIACRQSYTILTTDGFWNESYTSSSIAGASNAQWPKISGPNNQSWPTTAGSKPGVPFAGGNIGGSSSSNPSLADVALYYWEHDLTDGNNSTLNINNEVPISNDDPAFWQHMVTFTMGLGFTPTGISGTSSSGNSPPTPDDIFGAISGNTTLTNFSWPTPASNTINNIADLEHAGVNGHGGFYSATNPQTFASGLTNALNRAAARTGSGASLAANSTQLTTGTVAYQAQYRTVQWTGDLQALAVDSSTGAISTTASWSASAKLMGSATVNGTISTYPNRKVVTFVPSASSSGTFVNFSASGSSPPALSSAQLSALGSTASDQVAMVNYLRGDNALEQAKGGIYRTRNTPMGDIVDSQPVYAGAPNPNEFENQTFKGITNTATTGDNSFQAFAVGTTNGTTATQSAASKRTPLVFVAANDGMLHAFNASTGVEVYAYLPGAVITAGGTNSIKSLSSQQYGSTTVSSAPHQYFNDGELTIADAYFGSAWHTVLVGTTGRGQAMAVYALDITDPGNITPLWERSAGDGKTNSNYIGQMVGKPVIAKVQDAGTTDDWQVLMGNGYNSSSGTAALLEFNLYNGTLSVHTTDGGGLGLAAPVTWMDSPANGISTEAYAGDLGGNVWMFPLSTSTTTGTGSSATTTWAADLSTAATLEFTAVDPTDPNHAAQPITAGMLAGRDPVTGYVWVFFGTGKYLTSSDTTNKQVQTWYGVIVQPSVATTVGTGTSAVVMPKLSVTTTDASMVQRFITSEVDGSPDATPPTLGTRTVTTYPVPNDMAGKRGWYLNLEQPVGSGGNVSSYKAQGERMVTPSQFQGNLLLGTTRIPTAASSADICNASGSGWVMAVDPFTGTNPSGSFFLANGGNGTVTVGGNTLPVAGVGFSALPNNPIFVGGDMLMSFDNGTTSSLNTSGAAGIPQRVSWKELVNP